MDDFDKNDSQDSGKSGRNRFTRIRKSHLYSLIRNIFLLTPAFKQKENIILRDFLALERTKLANERTFLAYIRASLYLLLGGITFLQLDSFAGIKWIGYLSLFFSLLFIIIGIIRFFHLQKRLEMFYEEHGNDGLSE